MSARRNKPRRTSSVIRLGTDRTPTYALIFETADEQITKQFVDVPQSTIDEWAHALAMLLANYVSPFNWSQGEAITPLPQSAAARLRDLMARLAMGGTVPFPFSKLRKAGGLHHSPNEQAEIFHAVQYFQAADAGVVSHPKSRKDVAKLYGVSRDTLADWIKLYTPNLDALSGAYHEELRSIYPAALETSAARYRQIGRSWKAVESRNRKSARKR